MKTKLWIVIAVLGAFSFVPATAQTCKCAKKSAHSTAKKHTAKKSAVSDRKEKVYVSSKDVRDCPPEYGNGKSCLYDTNGNVQYVMSKSFSGYYPDNTESILPIFRELQISSTAFENFGVIPSKYTCEGSKASPPLSVKQIPAETKSLAVIVFDENATANSSHTYWMAWNIDTTGNIPENFVNDNMAINSSNEYGYQAVCPASGTHYYHFMVYALDAKLRTGKYTTKAKLEKVMNGHILAKGELVGRYNRTVAE